VAGGNLRLNGLLAAGSDVLVQSGGTLSGTGTASGTVTVESGGTVAPGASTGILHTGDLALASSATYLAEINGVAPGSGHDQLAVTGTVDLNSDAGAGATLSLSGSITSNPGQTIVLISNDASDAVTGTFAGLPEGAGIIVNGVGFTISYEGGDGNDVVLTEITALVTIGVSPTTVQEGGATQVYTFTRDITDRELTVSFTVGGTATFGADYSQTGAATFTGSTGTITMPVGVDTVELFVSPLTDSILEGQESIALSIVAGAFYQPGIPSSAIGLIEEAPLVADGATIDTFTRTGAPAGAFVTINPRLDANGDSITDIAMTVTSTDADPLTPGIQVLADGSGQYTFDLRRPTAIGRATVALIDSTGGMSVTQVDYDLVDRRRFDFNSNTSATQTPINSFPEVAGVTEVGGYIGVRTHDIFPSSFLGYGWDDVVDYASSSTTTGYQADLRRDAHVGNANEGFSKFSAQLENGTYLVTIVLGNPAGNAEGMQVFAEGVQVVSNGAVYSNRDRVDTFVVTVADNQFDLQIACTAGTLWALKGMTILPLAEANSVTLTSSLGNLPGNGVTVDTIEGTGPASSLITISSTLGTITTADADPMLSGLQVMTDADGDFSFGLQRPAMGGTPIITATAVDGTGRVSSSSVVTYLGGAGGGELGVFFDMGAATAESGYTVVTKTTSYSALNGYGWTTGTPDQTDRGVLTGTNFSNLLRDSVLGNAPATFRTDLANGSYDVTVIFGPGSNMSVGVTNGTVDSGLANVTGVSVPTGSFAHRSFQVTATNGRIDLQFSTTAASPWQIAGLVFRPIPTGTVTVTAPGGTLTADGVSSDTFMLTGLEVGRTYTVSTTAGTITTPDADTRFGGVQIVAAAASQNISLTRPARASAH